MENNAPDDQFAPEDVDEQIARYLQMPQTAGEQKTAEEHLVRELEMFYREDEAILGRSWQRLNDAFETEIQKQSMPSLAQNQERTRNPMIPVRPIPGRTNTNHRFSALVAGLVAVVVLGTLIATLTVAHLKGVENFVSNGQSVTTVATPEGVYVGGAGYVERLDQRSGHPFWKTALSPNPQQATKGPIVSNTLGVAQGVVYVTTLSNSVEAINVFNGKVLWSHFYAKGAKDGIYINPYKSNNGGVNNMTAPTVSGNVVFIATQNGITALSTRDGSIRYVLQGMNPDYVIENGVVYASNYTQVGNYSTFSAITAANGKTIWQKQISNVTFAKPQFADGIVYVPSHHTMVLDGDYLYAFSAKDGKQLLKINGAEGTQVVSITVAAGKIFVNELGGQMLEFDAKTGSEAWDQNIGWVGPGFPQVIGNTVYTITDNGVTPGQQGGVIGPEYGRLLFALDIRTGSGIWEYGDQNGNFDVSGVVAGSNTVYLLRVSGQITALTPDRKVLWNSTTVTNANFMTVAVAN